MGYTLHSGHTCFLLSLLLSATWGALIVLGVHILNVAKKYLEKPLVIKVAAYEVAP